MRKAALAVCVAALAGGSTSCAYYSQEDGERLQDEVYALQTQVTAMQQALAELQATEQRRSKRQAEMAQEVGLLSKAARRNDADLGVQLDGMMETVARLRGRVETFSERLATLEAGSSKLNEEIELRFQSITEQRKIDQTRSQAEKQRAIEGARRRERLLADPKAVLDEVRQLMSKKQPVEARKLLREVMLRHGKTSSFRRGRAGEAQFLIGETFFAEDNFQQAAAEYNAVRKKYPRSKWLPNALYGLGRCFENLNLPKDAKLFYETIMKKHARSSVAKKARKRLAVLR